MASVLETSLPATRVFKSCIPGWTSLFWGCYSVKTSWRKQSEWIAMSPCILSLYLIPSMTQAMELFRDETLEGFWGFLLLRRSLPRWGFDERQNSLLIVAFVPFTSCPFTSMARCNIVCSATEKLLKRRRNKKLYHCDC